MAGVAGGFEGMLPVRTGLSILVTGRSLREVLDAIVAADPRYEWRWDNEVVVFRPIESWHYENSPLHAPIGGLSLENIDAGDALGVLAQMVGAKPIHNTMDTRRFSVNVGDGATWLEGLNSIARAHGLLTWAIEPALPQSADFPLTMMLYIGAHGRGISIRAGAVLHTAIAAPHGHRHGRDAQPSPLDRIVGKALAQPFLAYGFHSLLPGLANAVRVPMGFQSLPAREGAVIFRPGINLTGLTLRDALDAMVALDPRYQWQELNGVIVVRPLGASEPQDPLSRLVPRLHLQDVTAAEPIAVVLKALQIGKFGRFPDTRSLSLSIPQGPVVDLLNEISRQHGELSWAWREIPPNERKEYSYSPPARFEIVFHLPDGGGQGYAVP